MMPIIDYGFVEPKENDIINFIKEISKKPKDKPDIWEKMIYDFYSKPFIYYFHEIETENIVVSSFYNNLKKLVTSFSDGVFFCDMNELYDKFIKISESIELSNENVYLFFDFFIELSFVMRKGLRPYISKIDDNEYSIELIPYSFNFENKGERYIETFYFLNIDLRIKYYYKKEIIQIRNNIIKEIKKLNPKIKKIKKRKNITKSIRHEVFVRDNYKCVECGCTQKEGTLHIDHIIPISKGGTDELSNLQTLCKECNLSKSNRIYKKR